MHSLSHAAALEMILGAIAAIVLTSLLIDAAICVIAASDMDEPSDPLVRIFRKAISVLRKDSWHLPERRPCHL